MSASKGASIYLVRRLLPDEDADFTLSDRDVRELLIFGDPSWVRLAGKTTINPTVVAMDSGPYKIRGHGYKYRVYELTGSFGGKLKGEFVTQLQRRGM